MAARNHSTALGHQSIQHVRRRWIQPHALIDHRIEIRQFRQRLHGERLLTSFHSSDLFNQPRHGLGMLCQKPHRPRERRRRCLRPRRHEQRGVRMHLRARQRIPLLLNERPYIRPINVLAATQPLVNETRRIPHIRLSLLHHRLRRQQRRQHAAHQREILQQHDPQTHSSPTDCTRPHPAAPAAPRTPDPP